jgi:hypothetical protein
LAATRFDVASAIVNSPEHFADFITGEYAQFLRRAPDPGGLNFFLGQMEQGMSPEAVEAAFVSSPEYILDHGNNMGTWLSGLYNDLLGRTPDVSGFNHWMSRLAAGETPFQIATEFAHSLERQSIVISQDYATFLGRTPDPGGMNHFLTLLQMGFTRSFVASDIIASTEFFQIHGNTDSNFVTAAFTDVLGRTPSPAELSFFVTQLEMFSVTPSPMVSPVMFVSPSSTLPTPSIVFMSS